MRRVVSLFLPTFATDRLRRSLGPVAPLVDLPLVIICREGRQRVVTVADRAARNAGIYAGMPATQAQALVPGLIVRDADPAGDLQALERLALWTFRRYSPIVAVDPPSGLVIDTTGADHLHGGEAPMLTGLVEGLSASGLTVRVAIADSWSAAHGFARYGEKALTVVPAQTSAEAILSLPIAALRLSPELVAKLRVLGFETVGDLAATPRAPLTLRFGPEIARRLDQAMGRLEEPIDPIRPPELIEIRRAFAEPIGAAETIARYTGKLVVELCAELEIKNLGVRQIDLLCHRVDNRIERMRIGTGKPVRDAKRLTRLLADKIETIDPGFGIELMVLMASRVEPLAPKQISSSLTDEPAPDVSALIDILSNRVGAEQLYRMIPVQSDVPERSVARVPPTAVATPESSWATGWPRPSRLLSQPEPIETVALLPDHPPVNFTWRGIRRRIKRADGPERIFGEWWKRDAELVSVRDYFAVEDEGGERFWLFRAGDGEDAATGSHQWFLHGIFA